MGFADREIHIQKKGSSFRSFLMALAFVSIVVLLVPGTIIGILL